MISDFLSKFSFTITEIKYILKLIRIEKHFKIVKYKKTM